MLLSDSYATHYEHGWASMPPVTTIRTINWPWFVDFLGERCVFYTNSWPPLPARILMNDRSHPVAAGIPEAFESPANEWYTSR